MLVREPLGGIADFCPFGQESFLFTKFEHMLGLLLAGTDKIKIEGE